MVLYFAPLEGLTDAIYRRVHFETFGGVHKYFMPFISPSPALSFTVRQQADFSRAANTGVPAVPQILAKDSLCFLEMAKALRDQGYTEVNLNLGCPSGTVTAKGKGAGMLRDPDALSRFLDAVFAQSPLPVSLKTRAGFSSLDEWPRLRDIVLRYPVKEWILHPRTGKEGYAGTPHRELYRDAAQSAPFPVLYNGDLFTVSECRAFLNEYPEAEGLMLGRGLAVNPALAQALTDGEKLTLETLRLFHDRLYRSYLKEWPEHAVIGRMHGILYYLIQAVDCPSPVRRQLRKASSVSEYGDAVKRLFSESTVLDEPFFTPP